MSEKKQTRKSTPKKTSPKRKTAQKAKKDKKATTARSAPARKATASKAPSKKTAAQKNAAENKNKSSSPSQKTRHAKPNSANQTKDSSTQSPPPLPDYMQNLDFLSELGEKSNELLSLYAQQFSQVSSFANDPTTIGKTAQELAISLLQNPMAVIQSQIQLWQKQAEVMDSIARQFFGNNTQQKNPSPAKDRRFSHAAWDKNPTLNFIKQSYFLYCDWARDLVAQAEGLDEHQRKKAEFYTEQFLAAMAPTNFAATNPEVLELAYESQGENFIKGYNNFMEDLQRGNGELSMKQVDLDYFQVGKNIATTPGSVIFQNDLLQLIQYAPTTEKVAKRPIVIFPPWINKFYILDLQPENSFIKWLVDQGRTVFVVSWVNPGPELKDKTFTDYIHEGVFETLSAIEQACGEKKVDTIGYCIGGTLLATALGLMAQTGDDRIASTTFFTAQMDFIEAGELRVFIDEEQLNNIEQQMEQAGGVLPASSMSQTFNMLRPNDLIWSVYIDNYLKGKNAKRFDLLYWNSDSTNMAKNVHIYYLREFYLENNLAEGRLKIDGHRIDLSKVTIPIFMQAGEKDHIAPYPSIYRSARLFGGKVEFMLAGSGHIAGVVNHPDKQKYHYSTNNDLPDKFEDWAAEAQRHEYSWWPYWIKWLNKQSRAQVTARKPGSGKLKALEQAPGSYVLR
ncbi:MAG: class I poly(R)-hydroxyalkanoic acid synthase [bacterium]